MKKLLLGLGSLIFSLSTFGQLADGATAPNFTATDINGNTHTLYDYLDAGKVVILDFSATWCGPCWSFHQGHVLKNIHEAYGPNGTDEAVVLFIEADPSTTYADLQGTGTNTQGDWITDTPYPIIDDASFAGSYNIGSFPTFYVVCPDRTLTHYDQTTEATNAVTWGDISSYIVSLGQACGNNALTGSFSNLAVGSMYSTPELCADQWTYLEVGITNYGTEVANDFDIKLMENGVEIGSRSVTGANIAPFQTKGISFDYIKRSNGVTLDFVIATPDGNLSDNSSTESLTLATSVPQSVEVQMNLDGWADETSWYIFDADYNTVFSQTYTTASNNTTQSHVVDLPGNGCYFIEVYDSYGDGNGGFSVSAYGTNYISNNGNFGSYIGKGMSVDNMFSTVEENNLTVNIYPNPATNEAFVSTNENFTQVEVLDLNGKVIEVIENADVDNYLSLNTSNLVNGVYFVKIYAENNTFTTQKLQIAK